MTIEASNAPRRHGHDWGNMMRTGGIVLLSLLAGGIATTWAWNTTVPELTALGRIRFAEGLSIAALVLLVGALLEVGRGIVRAALARPRE